MDVSCVGVTQNEDKIEQNERACIGDEVFVFMISEHLKPFPRLYPYPVSKASEICEIRYSLKYMWYAYKEVRL